MHNETLEKYFQSITFTQKPKLIDIFLVDE